MKRLIALAAVAILMVAGSASAQWGRHMVASANASFAGTAGAAQGPSTTNNDDSCDISVTPAATLLLPYFQVETAARATTTFFTVTNTSAVPQIAHVTIWTDWSFPVLDFNIYLTGYDVQPIDLYDVLVNGVIAPAAITGGAVGTGTKVSTNGKTNGGLTGGLTYNPLNFLGNPNFLTVASGTGGALGVASDCATLPGSVRSDIINAVRTALVTGTGYAGTGFGCTDPTSLVGSAASTHTTTTTAVGYVTVDVAATCNQMLPDEARYYTDPAGILYDNTLTGDYQILNRATGSNYAGGDPLVHIRAIPEGGPAGSLPPGVTNLPYTFYSRYINTSTGFPSPNNRDRRQPLPSVFAARWIQGGSLALNTNYRIWREGLTGPSAPVATQTFVTPTDCTNVVVNSVIPLTEVVRFDEHENVQTIVPTGCPTSPCISAPSLTLPESSDRSVTDTTVFPPATFVSGDVGGWMYLNLNSGGLPAVAPTYPTYPTTAASGAYNGTLHPGATMARSSQNWVIVALSGSGSQAGAYGVDFSATWLGNGCSGPVGQSGLGGAAPSAVPIGPVGGVPVCPTGVTCTGTYPGTNTTP